MATSEAEPIEAANIIDRVTVGEIVAYHFHCDYPPAETTQAWLDKHADEIQHAMHGAAIAYIAAHWKDTK